MKPKNHFLEGPWSSYIILLLLITITLWSAYNLVRTDEETPQPRVSVLVEDSSNERWTAFRLGLDQAAREYGADVTFITSSVFSGAEDQKNLISQEAAGSTDALILSPYDSEETDYVSGAVKLVYVETDGIRDRSEGTVAVVPSGRKMGEALGQMLLGRSGLNESSGLNETGIEEGGSSENSSNTETVKKGATIKGVVKPYVAILLGNIRRYSQMEMLQGLTEVIESVGGSVFPIETKEGDLSDAMARAKKADLIAVLDDRLLMEAAKLLASDNFGESILYGVGCSPSNISYLDRGVISGMVVPNEFTMGYQSLAQLTEFLNKDIPVMQDIEVGFTCVRTDDVHNPAYEKLLFPVIQ